MSESAVIVGTYGDWTVSDAVHQIQGIESMGVRDEDAAELLDWIIEDAILMLSRPALHVAYREVRMHSWGPVFTR